MTIDNIMLKRSINQCIRAQLLKSLNCMRISMKVDVMRMVKVDAIDVPAHGPITLEPGGYHVMLVNLKKPLVAGEALP